jgi:hypothetical protein
MKTVQWLFGTAALAGLLISCGNTKALDRDGVNVLKVVGPSALGSSTDFLRGSPIKLQSSVDLFQQIAKSNVLTQHIRQPQLNMVEALSNRRLRTMADTVQCNPNEQDDNDQDGIVKNVNCTIDALDENDSDIRYKGKLIIRDANDNPGGELSGYLFDFDVTATEVGVGDLRTRLFAEVKAPTKGGDPYQVQQIFNFELTSGSDKLGFKYANTAKYTPSTATSFDAGLLEIVAKLDFNLNADRYNVDFSAKFDVDIARCSTEITDGQAVFTSGQNVLKWDSNGCGQDGDWDESGLKF